MLTMIPCNERQELSNLRIASEERLYTDVIEENVAICELGKVREKRR